ncbi:MAG: acyl-CoA desaturase [Actinomycetota bacterium]|nr:acyl-CoA desaturase [Actinomycetota bacterium]
MTITAPPAPPAAAKVGDRAQPIYSKTKGFWEQAVLYLFVIVPFVALLAAVPLLWGWGMGWLDLALLVGMFTISGHGITVGFHRHFTHGSFKAAAPLRAALVVAGSMAVQGPVTQWVADHRRHHAFSDREGDPHSPWRYGDTVGALTKGMFHAHIGWLFDRNQTNPARYAPDLLKDSVVRLTGAWFILWAFLGLALPAVLGGLITMSWIGALTGFFWGGLVRVAVLHHVTWSINSICHMVGARPFAARDKSANVWPLAILSMGESWHNLHHADPTCARHGVLPGQIDSSARLIWLFEKFGWVRDVRWPDPMRLAARRVAVAPSNT